MQKYILVYCFGIYGKLVTGTECDKYIQINLQLCVLKI